MIADDAAKGRRGKLQLQGARLPELAALALEFLHQAGFRTTPVADVVEARERRRFPLEDETNRGDQRPESGVVSATDLGLEIDRTPIRLCAQNPVAIILGKITIQRRPLRRW